MNQNSSLPVIDLAKYSGKQIAIADGNVIAVGETLAQVVSRARQLMPQRPLHEIKIFSVPVTLSVIYVVRVPLRNHTPRKW